MFHPERPYRRGVVVSDLFLFGIEAHALPDYDFAFALWGSAPYSEGELEADGEDAGGDVFGARAEGVGGFVEGWGVVGIRRIVSAHIEALHGEWWWWGTSPSWAGCVAEVETAFEKRMGDLKSRTRVEL